MFSSCRRCLLCYNLLFAFKWYHEPQIHVSLPSNTFLHMFIVSGLSSSNRRRERFYCCRFSSYPSCSDVWEAVDAPNVIWSSDNKPEQSEWWRTRCSANHLCGAWFGPHRAQISASQSQTEMTVYEVTEEADTDSILASTAWNYLHTENGRFFSGQETRFFQACTALTLSDLWSVVWWEVFNFSWLKQNK